jgi:putative hydrolase of the HAD superfamily
MRIRNVVFDLGNVLISYQPESFHLGLGDSPTMTQLYVREIYDSSEWQMIDKGVMTVDEAIESIASRSVLSARETARIFNLREQLLLAIDYNTELLKRLKKAGLHLFYITNFPEDMFSLLSSKYDFFRLFNGGVVSSSEKVLKPDLQIYRILINRYGIDPKESLFIDDLAGNIDGAGKAGFMTMHLSPPEWLEKNLRILLPEAFKE